MAVEPIFWSRVSAIRLLVRVFRFRNLSSDHFRWRVAAPGGKWQVLSIQSSIQSSTTPIRHPLPAKTFFHLRCFTCMRYPALLLALLATLPLFAADEKKPTEPVTKPAEKTEPAVKNKKGLDSPEIPEGVSLSDGVKLQEAWLAAEKDPAFLAVFKKNGGGAKPKKSEGEKTKGGAREAKAGRQEIDEARVKAMQQADPSLNIQLIRAYVESSHQKKPDVAGKPKKK